MIAVQTVLLKVALDNRPPPGAKGSLETTPFVATPSKESFVILERRPYDFWRWRSPKPWVPPPPLESAAASTGPCVIKGTPFSILHAGNRSLGVEPEANGRTDLMF